MIASPEELVTLGFLALIVTFIVQATKKWVAEDFIPIYAFGWGIALALIVGVFALNMRQPSQLAILAFTGFLAGASAIGYYEGQGQKVLSAKKPTDISINRPAQ